MRGVLLTAGLATFAVLAGCSAAHPHHLPALDTVVPSPDMPRELSKIVLPTYTIEPPDILVVEAIHIVPRSPYLLRTGDVISVNVLRALPDSPIAGAYVIQPGGAVNFGVPYGAVKVSGLSIEQAEAGIRSFLVNHLKEPFSVSASLVEIASKQQIAGQHLVGMDGNVTLGSYGNVSVVGRTIAEAKQAIEEHLGQFLEDPEVAVDVFALNSKVYYVITEGAGLGDTVSRFPVTGNETVLDAIANVSGLTEVSSKKIWIARPVPCSEDVHLLPVDWRGITALGQATTNYQVLPGDRIFIAENELVAFDSQLAKILAPVERAMGFTLLGTGTATRLSGKVLRGGGNPNSGGFSGR
ncbi:MAG TPA: polysaccharide biosynthesis/export family protein [Pirellulaceae bacterium]|nr:polysaccharide biosynthesis/export family protein [Pirellulaceae bacterium]